jgi:arylsulfatase A-like enzyme
MISGIDLVIGRLRAKLNELDLADNTVIIFTSDNGYFLGERGYAGKWLPYDQSIHVPLILFDPRGQSTKPGARPTAMALNIDLPPTILDLAGLPTPASMQGRSLLPLARGESPSDWRTDFWIEHLMMEPTIRKHEGVRTTRHRYARYFEATPVFEELYDLQADPLETTNLINNPAHRDTLRALRTRTDELQNQYGGDFSARLWKEPQP